MQRFVCFLLQRHRQSSKEEATSKFERGCLTLSERKKRNRVAACTERRKMLQRRCARRPSGYGLAHMIRPPFLALPGASHHLNGPVNARLISESNPRSHKSLQPRLITSFVTMDCPFIKLRLYSHIFASHQPLSGALIGMTGVPGFPHCMEKTLGMSTCVLGCIFSGLVQEWLRLANELQMI